MNNIPTPSPSLREGSSYHSIAVGATPVPSLGEAFHEQKAIGYVSLVFRNQNISLHQSNIVLTQMALKILALDP